MLRQGAPVVRPQSDLSSAQTKMAKPGKHAVHAVSALALHVESRSELGVGVGACSNMLQTWLQSRDYVHVFRITP